MQSGLIMQIRCKRSPAKAELHLVQCLELELEAEAFTLPLATRLSRLPPVEHLNWGFDAAQQVHRYS